MSDSPDPRPTYDPNELRRCIALCFSSKDLRSLVESLGVTEIGSWDRGIQEAAREVVRHFERLGTLDVLVVKLAEARPLTEWPARRGDVAAAPAAETNISPMAAPPETAASPVQPAPHVAKPDVVVPEPVIRDPFAPAWPGTAAPTSATNTRRSRGRTRMLAAAVAMVAVVAIGIWIALRMGKGAEPLAGAGELRPNGPARMAADAMTRSLERLARVCDVQVAPGTDVGVWIFPAAYSQCGARMGGAFPPPGLRLDRPMDTAGAPLDATEPEPPPAMGLPKKTNPSRDTAPRPLPDKVAPSDGCVAKCAATKHQCNRGCGAEPASRSEYDRWQGCQTKCLSAASKCQLACP